MSSKTPFDNHFSGRRAMYSFSKAVDSIAFAALILVGFTNTASATNTSIGHDSSQCLPLFIGETALGSLDHTSNIAGTVKPLGERSVALDGHLNYILEAHRKQVVANFFDSSQVIYRADTTPRLGSEFFASNEFDWHKMPIDLVETDVVVGFGTNSAWDIAVRKNAKLLILSDWSTGPLFAQEMLMRPLILEAKTPNEFISILIGLPLPPSLKSAPISSVFQYFNKLLDDSNDDTSGLVSAKKTFYAAKLQTIKQNHNLTAEQIKNVESYFLAQANLIRSSNDPHNFGPFDGYYVTQKVGFLYKYFQLRYDPNELIKDGASRSKVNDPLFSFLSSQDAYDRLKKLFVDRVFYSRASIDDFGTYEAAKNLANKLHLKRFTVATSNVFDTGSDIEAMRAARVRYYLSRLAPLLASVDSPLYFYQTRNTSPPHKFEILDIANALEVDQTLKKAGYRSIQFNEPPKSLAEAALEIIVSQVPTVVNGDARKLELNFSDKLLVTIHKGQPIQYQYFEEKTFGYFWNRSSLLMLAGDMPIATTDERQLLDKTVLDIAHSLRQKNDKIVDSFLNF
jgi:hypothetical protein